MSKFLELAERCEAETGMNYDLGLEIFKAMHPKYAGYVSGRGGLIHPQDGSDQRVPSDVRPANYTASLDAALTLLPCGWGSCRADMSIPGRAHWMIEGPKTKFTVDEDGYLVAGSDWYVTAVAATPSLAICAAALRARHAMEASNG